LQRDKNKRPSLADLLLPEFHSQFKAEICRLFTNSSNRFLLKTNWKKKRSNPILKIIFEINFLTLKQSISLIC